MEKIGAYYQCYMRPNAVEFVLSNYRKIYKNSSIVLVNDGGFDFKYLSDKYNCVYHHEKKIETTYKNLIFENSNQLKVFIDRIISYISEIKEDFFMILEDDVWVIERTRTEDLVYDINGCNHNEFMEDAVCDYLKTENNNIKKEKIFIGGCGGSILNKSFFEKNLCKNKKINEDIEIYSSMCNKNNIASDRFLSFICWKYNGTIGQYKGFCETWYSDLKKRIEEKNIEVLHQYKEKY